MIDEGNHDIKKKKVWRLIMERIFSIIVFLAEINLRHRVYTKILGNVENGNFLGQIELMANCNEVMMEHSQKATKPGLCYLLQ